MFTLYLACLIFGLGMFAVQMFASHGADHHGLPSGAPEGLALGHAAPGESGAPGNGEHAHDPGGPGDANWASIFVSLRFYVFAAFGLGAVGAPVTAFDLSPPGLTFVVALATAVGVGTLASVGFRWLGRETLSSGSTQAELVGQVGRVLVACEKGRKGKVRLTVRGQTLDFVATTDETRLPPGALVIVQDVEAERVQVCAAPSELLPVNLWAVHSSE